MKQNPTDDELLRSYLLGEIPAPEADRLEQRLLAEDDLFDLMEALEAELLASASRGDLAPAERERVLRRLASSPEGRERLALARSLNALADEKEAAVLPFRRRETSPKPVFRWAAALAAAGLLAVVGLLSIPDRTPDDNGHQAPQITHDRPAPAQPVPQRKSVPPTVIASPTPEPSPTPDQLVRKAPEPRVAKKPEPVKAVFALALMTLRGAEETEEFSLPANAEVAEIQIDLEGLEDSGPFHAFLHNEEQGTVWEEDGLKAQKLSWGTALVLEIPAKSLKPGRYEVGVTIEGDSEAMTQEFDIVRRDL